MADEKGLDFTKLKVERQKKIEVVDCSWTNLVSQSGNDLVDQYADTLRALGAQPGMLGDIYAGAQSRFNNPVNLKRLVGLIDETEWTELGVDVKAAAYEGLLEKAASEGKKGAGQYFTPRVLIQSIVRCMKPDPRKARDFTICDPACGTGGFLVSAYEWLAAESKGGALDRDVAKRVKRSTYHGQELVPRPRRMALMNLYLHGIEPTIRLGFHRPAAVQRPLRRDPDQSALRHQGRQPESRARRFHRRHLEQAAQLRPARADHPQARWPRGRGPARQLPVR
jgi:type I restriction enzyme M protein